jgi:hypothetical protein
LRSGAAGTPNTFVIGDALHELPVIGGEGVREYRRFLKRLG